MRMKRNSSGPMSAIIVTHSSRVVCLLLVRRCGEFPCRELLLRLICLARNSSSGTARCAGGVRKLPLFTYARLLPE